VKSDNRPGRGCVPFPRGFPSDWPVRPGNFIQLDWLAATRNHIHLWLPEGVSARGHGRLLMILREEADFRFERTGEDRWRHWFEKPGLLRLEGSVAPIEHGIEMGLALTNLSDEDWRDVTAGVCVQFHAAPDFYDPERRRTFYPSGGRLRTFEGPCSEGEGGRARFFGSGRDASSPHPPADAGLIGIHSKDGRHVAATWWEGARHVGGNAHPATLCIHSDPVFGDIPAGASVSRRGRLYLMPGTPEDARERFQRDAGAPA